MYIQYTNIKERKNLILWQQITNSLRDLSFGYVVYPEGFPENITSEDGKELLSWRVAFYLKNLQILRHGEANFDLAEPWTSETNQEAAIKRPFFCFNPYDRECKYEMKTCLVCIKEIAELRKKDPHNEILRNKAIFVLVDPEYAVPWTAPEDISWKDLASGKIKLYVPYGTVIHYVKANNFEQDYTKDIPKTFDEWKDFCGIDEDVVVDEEKPSL